MQKRKVGRPRNKPNDNQVLFRVSMKLGNLKKLGNGSSDRGIEAIKEIVRSKDSELDKE